jgi:hypothetical protein
MTYKKPRLNRIGDAQRLVLGTKHVPPLSDNMPPDYRKSVAAYESDE